METMPPVIPERPERGVFREVPPVLRERSRIGMGGGLVRGRESVRAGLLRCRRGRMTRRRSKMRVAGIRLDVACGAVVRNVMVPRAMVRNGMVRNGMVRNPVVRKPMVRNAVARNAAVHMSEASAGAMAVKARPSDAASMSGKMRCAMHVSSTEMRRGVTCEVRHTTRMTATEMRCGDVWSTPAEMRSAAANMRSAAAEVRSAAAKVWRPTTNMRRSSARMRSAAARMRTAAAGLGGECSTRASRQHQPHHAGAGSDLQCRGNLFSSRTAHIVLLDATH